MFWNRWNGCSEYEGWSGSSVKKESLTRGIKVRISEDNHVSLSFHIIVAYGVSISAVTDNLISNVKYRVEEFSGMPVDKINIYIEGVRVID
mgnify:CR=1 FL=1